LVALTFIKLFIKLFRSLYLTNFTSARNCFNMHLCNLCYYVLLNVPCAGRPLCIATVSLFLLFFHSFSYPRISETAGDLPNFKGRRVVGWDRTRFFRFSNFCRKSKIELKTGLFLWARPLQLLTRPDTARPIVYTRCLI